MVVRPPALAPGPTYAVVPPDRLREIRGNGISLGPCARTLIEFRRCSANNGTGRPHSAPRARDFRGNLNSAGFPAEGKKSHGRATRRRCPYTIRLSYRFNADQYTTSGSTIECASCIHTYLNIYIYISNHTHQINKNAKQNNSTSNSNSTSTTN